MVVFPTLSSPTIITLCSAAKKKLSQVNRKKLTIYIRKIVHMGQYYLIKAASETGMTLTFGQNHYTTFP